jgi:transposase
MLSMKRKTPKTLTLDSIHKLPGAALKEGSHALKNAERWIMTGGKTPLVTPPEKALTDYFTRPLTEEELVRREREKAKKKRKKAREARKKQEIYVSAGWSKVRLG